MPRLVRARPPAAYAEDGAGLRFLRFWWDFVVGDDWMAAAGVVAAIAITAATRFWWLLPLAVVAVLYVSVRRSAA